MSPLDLSADKLLIEWVFHYGSRLILYWSDGEAEGLPGVICSAWLLDAWLPSKIKPLVVVVFFSFFFFFTFQISSGWSTCGNWCAHVNSPNRFEWALPCGRYRSHSGSKLSKKCSVLLIKTMHLSLKKKKMPREQIQHIVPRRLIVRLFPDHMVNVHLAK